MPAATIAMQERAAPSRPSRLGTHRRRPKGAASAAGASRSAGRRAPSLDTEKQLATSCENWLKEQETPWDSFKSRERLWRRLCDTVHIIWQNEHDKPKDDGEQQWWNCYEQELADLKADQCPGYDEWLQKHLEKLHKRDMKENPAARVPFAAWVIQGRVPTEAYLRKLYVSEWIEKNRPEGRCARILEWEKQYAQLLHCQGEWIGYSSPAGCCSSQSRPIAIPIGCNHRLCPLCSWHRSEKAQKKTKVLFDRLTNPQFLTLTAPNIKIRRDAQGTIERTIRKRDLHFFRKKVNEFIAMHKSKPGQAGMFAGGIYAIETTYNRTEESWHIHAHVLMDGTYTLPAKHKDECSADQRFKFAGGKMLAFTYIKMALEYDWTALWMRTTDKKRRARSEFEWPKLRKNSSAMEKDGSRNEFEMWVRGCFANALKEWRRGEYVPIQGLSPEELKRRTEWNKLNRRVIWIKPVNDREKAAKEVLKYITKSADFCDLPDCVQAFYDATKSARLVQTFGSWYGLDINTVFDPKQMDDWAEMKCTCGAKMERIGVFQRRNVQMDEGGRWYLKRPFDYNSQGTIPRPTIRALEKRESEENQPWQIR